MFLKVKVSENYGVGNDGVVTSGLEEDIYQTLDSWGIIICSQNWLWKDWAKEVMMYALWLTGFWEYYTLNNWPFVIEVRIFNNGYLTKYSGHRKKYSMVLLAKYTTYVATSWGLRHLFWQKKTLIGLVEEARTIQLHLLKLTHILKCV